MRYTPVFDWNLVATVRDRRFKRAFEILEEVGVVHPTGLYNVLVVRTPDVRDALDELRARTEPEIFEALGRVVPVTHTFRFGSVEDFETRVRDVALGWAPRLEGKAFRVRMHRRGWKDEPASAHQERSLDQALLQTLQEHTPGRIDFADPDAILVIEAIGDTAGMALWTREDMERYPFLGRSLDVTGLRGGQKWASAHRLH